MGVGLAWRGLADQALGGSLGESVYQEAQIGSVACAV